MKHFVIIQAANSLPGAVSFHFCQCPIYGTMAGQVFLLALCLLMASRQAFSLLSPGYRNQKRMIYALFETSSVSSSTLTTNQQQIDEAWARLLEGTDGPSISSFSSISSITPDAAVINKPLDPPVAEIVETSPDIISAITSEPLPLDDNVVTTYGKSALDPILDSVSASTSAPTLDPSPYTPAVQNALRIMFPGIKFNEVPTTPPSDKAPTLYEYIRDGKLATDVSKDMVNTKENALVLQSEVQKISRNLQDMIALDVKALQDNLSAWFKSITTTISSDTAASPFLPSIPSALTHPNPTTTTIIAAASTVTMIAIYTQRQEQQQIRQQQHQQKEQMEQQLKEANEKANQAVALAENAVNNLAILRQQIERSASTASQSLINKSKMEQLVIENDLYKQQLLSMERELQQLQAQLEKLLQEKLILEQYVPVYDLSEEFKEHRKKPLVQGKQVNVSVAQVTDPPKIYDGNGSREEADNVILEKVADFKSKKLPTILNNKQLVSIDSPIIENNTVQESPAIVAKLQEGTVASIDEKMVNVSQKRKRKGMVENAALINDNELLMPDGIESPVVGSNVVPNAQEIGGEVSLQDATEDVESKKKSGTAKQQDDKQKLKTPTLVEKVGTTKKGSALKKKKQTANQEEKVQEFRSPTIVEDSIYGKPHPWAALSDTTLSRKTIPELTSFLSDRGAEVTINGKSLSKKEILIKVRSML